MIVAKQDSLLMGIGSHRTAYGLNSASGVLTPYATCDAHLAPLSLTTRIPRAGRIVCNYTLSDSFAQLRLEELGQNTQQYYLVIVICPAMCVLYVL